MVPVVDRLMAGTTRSRRSSPICETRSASLKLKESLKVMPEPTRPGPSNPIRWFPEFLEFGKRRFRSQGRVLAACILVGFVAGVGGILFTILGQLVFQGALGGIVGYQPEGPLGEVKFPWVPRLDATFQPWLLLIVPTVGGLLSGFLVFRFAPEAEGHGTDAAIDAYHNKQGFIRTRVPVIKMISSALTIGTGGSGGREGPIAQIGAGFGSLLSRTLGLRAQERRILLAAGMGAGISAIFRAPLAGALFASEVLYSSPEFESEVILPTGLSSVVSYCTFGAIAVALGGAANAWQPLFQTPSSLVFRSAFELLPYTLLAIWVAILAMIYVRTFYGVTHLFSKLRLPRMFRPALGAALTGAVGLGLFYATGQNKVVLSVISYGYGVLQDGLSHELSLSAGLLLAIAFGKIATTSLTIGSGGSGGVFGPSMVIGGCGGGSLGLVLHAVSPTLVPHPGTYVILGMAGFFAAAAKTPFSTLIIVSEMTGDYRLLLPSLWVCSIAFLLSDEESLYHSQVRSRSLSPAHQGDYARDVLANMSVEQFLRGAADFPCLSLGDSLESVVEKFESTTFSCLPVVDESRRFLGIVALDELHLAARTPHANTWLIAADLMRSDIRPLRPEDRLDYGMELFAENDTLVLPVVDGVDDKNARVVGLVRRSDMARAYLFRLHGKRAGSKE